MSFSKETDSAVQTHVTKKQNNGYNINPGDFSDDPEAKTQPLSRATKPQSHNY